MDNIEIDRIMNEARRRLDNLSGIEDKLSEIIGKGSSDSGLVSIEVGSKLDIISIDISNQAMRLAADDLEIEIISAFSKASKEVGERSAELLSNATGEGSSSKPGKPYPDVSVPEAQEMMSKIEQVTKSGNPESAALKMFEEMRKMMGPI
jgi:DNA-binding protein YbaB